MPPQREAFFLGDGDERRFCLVSRPAGRPIGALLHVHAFAEELNRSRRMVALAAQAFTEQGFTVLQMDLHGCGDSEGDFGDASWASWLADIDRAHAWLSGDTSAPKLLWGLRAGALLAASWLAQRHQALPLLAWQPVLNGKQYLTQFLRIRLGADLAQSTQAGQVLTELRATLQQGQAVSIAGYWLSPQMAADLEATTFRLPAAHPAPVMALELGSGEAPGCTPALENWLNAARKAGQPCEALAVAGNKFWQSQETETAPALIPPSLDALRAWVN